MDTIYYHKARMAQTNYVYNIETTPVSNIKALMLYVLFETMCFIVNMI